MHRQTKLALFIAPFLLVGGYIASDMYVESEQNKPKYFQFKPVAECQMFKGDCIFESGDVQINITDRDGQTKINTSHPADKVVISQVYGSGDETIYSLDRAGNAQYWQRETDIRKALVDRKDGETLRVMIQIKGATYLGEFSPQRP